MIKRFFPGVLLLAILLSISPGYSAHAEIGLHQQPEAARAAQMLAQMTPEEKVGQLFMVAFTGSSANQDSQIYDLIVHHHVGGVMLLAGNDNFVQGPNTVSSAYQLIAQLQNAEWQASQSPATSTPPAGTPTPEPTATVSAPSNYIPLFVGVEQDGNGYPTDQILNGLTQLPSLMAIGATWQPTLAEQVGLVAGQELSSLGFNFFVGPSLDVLESPETTSGNGLDANVFGGDPYWVGTMGSAYITGLHTGSDGKMVVIADHFPGRGSADRPAGQEPATVRKSLEQLKQIELAPFFTVTGNAQSQQSTADGLLVSHIRYQGFQGNIRSTTRPVSFDPQALTQILSLPAFASWRAAGGLMVSDDLGSPTVRSFYDPGQPFLARLVARDAFLAGNDMLYMGNIVSSDASDNYSSLLQVFDFFTQKYSEDTAFAKRVDDAVTRILAVKYGLYNYFSPNLVIPSESGLSLLGQLQSQSVVSEVARQSATLVSPDSLDLETLLPNPPGIHDQIVFLTDTRPESQCTKCGQQPMLAVDALQKVILRLYGPQSGGQMLSGRMISYSFDALGAILPGGAGNVALEGSLNQATWVIINMLDAEPGQTQTTLLKRFLSSRQDLLRDKHVIVFAFNAPYFLDSTDISYITAYYCLYSKGDPFVEVAARILFRELSPVGILPVSVEGINYDLLSATSPDPNQVISLSLDTSQPNTSGTKTTTTPQPTFTPFFSVGQTVSVKTGVILDHNGHPVPDGTGVQFTIQMSGANAMFQQIDAVTSQGIASAPFNIPQAGLLQISATSDPALDSVVLQLDVTSSGYSISYATPTEMSQPTPTPTITPTATPGPTTPLKQGYPGFGSWFTMVAVLSALGYLAYYLGDRFGSRRWGIRSTMCVALGGLLTYTYLAMRLPGAASYLQANGWMGITGVVLAGALLGGAAAFAWFRLVMESKKQSG